MADSDLLCKVEAAASAVCAALSFSASRSHFTGLDDGTLLAPNTVCSARLLGDEFPKFTGNMGVTLIVTVNTKAQDSGLTAHRADVATVFDAFMMSDLAATLSANTGLHVFGIIDRRVDHNPRAEGVLSDFIELDIAACASDIS